MRRDQHELEILQLLLELIKDKCSENINHNEQCSEALEMYFDIVSQIVLSRSRIISNRYKWIDKVIAKGLPDGRKRFILYVLSAYLANIRNLNEEEALNEIKKFLENSCRNYGNCEKIYESWIRSDLARVKRKGLKPARFERLDEDLKEHIKEAIREEVSIKQKPA